MAAGEAPPPLKVNNAPAGTTPLIASSQSHPVHTSVELPFYSTKVQKPDLFSDGRITDGASPPLKSDARPVETTPHLAPVSTTVESYSSIVRGQRCYPTELTVPKKLTSVCIEEESQSFKPCSLYQGKPSVEFSSSERQKLVENIPFVLIGKFSHGRPSMPEIRGFFANLNLQCDYNLSSFDSKHLYIECKCKRDYYKIWLKLVWKIKGFTMRVFKWDSEFSLARESPIAPVWIRLTGPQQIRKDIAGLPSFLPSSATGTSVARKQVSNVKGSTAKVDTGSTIRSSLGWHTVGKKQAPLSSVVPMPALVSNRFIMLEQHKAQLPVSIAKDLTNTDLVSAKLAAVETRSNDITRVQCVEDKIQSIFTVQKTGQALMKLVPSVDHGMKVTSQITLQAADSVQLQNLICQGEGLVGDVSSVGTNQQKKANAKLPSSGVDKIWHIGSKGQLFTYNGSLMKSHSAPWLCKEGSQQLSTVQDPRASGRVLDPIKFSVDSTTLTKQTQAETSTGHSQSHCAGSPERSVDAAEAEDVADVAATPDSQTKAVNVTNDEETDAKGKTDAHSSESPALPTSASMHRVLNEEASAYAAESAESKNTRMSLDGVSYSKAVATEIQKPKGIIKFKTIKKFSHLNFCDEIEKKKSKLHKEGGIKDQQTSEDIRSFKGNQHQEEYW